MSTQEARRRAEREFDRRSLDRLVPAVADPRLREQARQLAAGTLSAADFVRGMHRSPAAVRGLDRYLDRYRAFDDQDLAAIQARKAARVAEIMAELTGPTAPPADPAARALDEAETWEGHSWLDRDDRRPQAAHGAGDAGPLRHR